MVDYRDVIFFISISIMTIIVVQSVIYFINVNSSHGIKIIVIGLEVSVIVIIVKIYDNLSVWEKISKVVSKDRVFSSNLKETIRIYKNKGGLIKYCSYCGYNINIDENLEEKHYRNELEYNPTVPKYCINCGNKINV
ncbi:MAG: hypothetical protein DA328_05915 [Nitrososphaeraceae archaeon]|nr:hypothetical protein [Nitrososphaeraceae archaeon]